jgi:L-threonylcarbamoyladenylate synthase
MIIEITNSKIDKTIIETAISILNDSGIIAFPTDTVYGLGCNMMNDNAIRKIFEIKGRDFDKPLAAHVSSIEQIALLSDNIPDTFYKLADKFLPGPLNIIINKKSTVSDIMTSGFQTIGIRFPDDEICTTLISEFGRPLAATSANLSGRTSPVSGEDVISQFAGTIPLILNAGMTKYKQESTIISLVDDIPKLLRSGAIQQKQLEDVLGISLAS